MTGIGLSGQRVLLTGASGVVGSAVLDRLLALGAEVVCLAHRRAVGTGDRPVPTVIGDIAVDRFGLPPRAYDELADQVDVIVHCAALTQLGADPATIEAANVAGPRTVARFAARVGAPVVHLSTAFVARAARDVGEAGVHYARSKERGEQVVRSAGVPYVILRPSIVIGGVRDGRIAGFQGLFSVVHAVVARLAPAIPFEGDWLVDMVSQDVVVDAVVAMLRAPHWGAELWLSAGPAAPTVREVVDEIRALGARRTGVEIPPARFVGPDVYRRLVEPVFLPRLPAEMRAIARRLSTHLAPYLMGTEPFETSIPYLGEHCGVDADPDPRTALIRSLDHWADVTGFGRGRAAAS